MSNTLKGRCGACDHIFIVAHLPMDLGKAAKLMRRAACPKCASTEIFAASSDRAIDANAEASR